MIKWCIFYVAGLTLTNVEGLKIGFLGDSGISGSGSNNAYAKAVYQMLNNENVDLVIQNGDLAYKEKDDPGEGPPSYETLLNQFLDPKNIDFLASSGNHERVEWSRPSTDTFPQGYQDVLKARHERSSRLNGKCIGEYGEKFACEYEDNHFILLGWVQTHGEAQIIDSKKFLETQLLESQSTFKWCIWHGPENRFSGGPRAKNEGQGIDILYEVCRQYGAVIISGHEHVYSRTKLLTSFLEPPVVDIQASATINRPVLTCGRSFSVITGIGGKSFNTEGPKNDELYWHQSYHLNEKTAPINEDFAGALICDTDGTDATCVFKTTSTDPKVRNPWDSFSIDATNVAGQACTGPTPPPTPMPSYSGGTFYRFATKENDVEEDVEDGQIKADSPDLGLAGSESSGPRLVGIRFPDIPIPYNARIISAKLIFRSAEDVSQSFPSLKISGHLSENSPLYSTSSTFDEDGPFRFDLARRKPTQANVHWLPNAPWQRGQQVETPSLVNILQEIIDQPKWKQGNAVSFIIQGYNQHIREVYAADAGLGPQLVFNFASTLAPTPAPTFTFNKIFSIWNTLDDVEQKADGRVKYDSSDLELTYDDGNQIIGLRYQNFQIPPQAKILSANLNFQADEEDKGKSPILYITCENSPNSQTFSLASYSLSYRPKTANQVVWYNLPNWYKRSRYTSPDISSIIQEVISNPGWQEGNAISFFINKAPGDTSSSKRVAESFDGRGAPFLLVTYSVHGSGRRLR